MYSFGEIKRLSNERNANEKQMKKWEKNAFMTSEKKTNKLKYAEKWKYFGDDWWNMKQKQGILTNYNGLVNCLQFN